MASQTTREAWDVGAQALAKSHPVPARLLDQHGPPRLGAKPPAADRFETLGSAIAHQQLAGKAAAAIWGRVQVAVGPAFTPAAVLEIGPQRLRACGLSSAKVAAILDLALTTAEGGIQFDRIARLKDQAVINQLTAVKGIGPWTAQMFLMFDLRRIDIWPSADYGVRAGFTRAFKLAEMPTIRELDCLGEPFAPYRSILAWWCWRETDTKS
ncbi:MAG: DNA-3-methyladenine glycosylase 2 family protein [Actinomycetes bacterium]